MYIFDICRTPCVNIETEIVTVLKIEHVFFLNAPQDRKQRHKFDFYSCCVEHATKK